MKKNIFALCALSIGLLEGISQNISYKIGGEYTVTERHKDLGYFLTAGNKPANVSFIREQEFSIQPIDLNTLNVQSGNSHDISSLGENKIFEKVLNLKDNLFYIYSYVNKKNKTRVVSAKLIDDNNTSVTNKNVVLFESEEPKTVYLTPMTATRYYFTISTNKDFGLITYILPSRKAKARENKDVLGFNLFDKNFNKKWTKDVEMPYTEQIMSIMDYHVTSKGEVFMLIRVFDETHLANYNDMMEHARYELVKISGDAELQKKELDLGGRYFKNAKLTDDLNGNLVIAGYYGNTFAGSGANGIYVLRFGDNASKATTKFFDFTLEMLKSYETIETQETIEKGGRLDARLYLDDIFFHPNGDVLIVNEQYKSVDNGNSSKNYFLDIVALKFDKDGKLIWIKKIPKNQTGAGRSDLSYKYHYNNGNDYFIFVDNENNLNLGPNEAPKAHVCRLGGYLVAVKMDPQGNMKKIPILDVRKEDVSVFPIDLFKVDDNTLIGRCSKDRKRVLIKIDFK